MDNRKQEICKALCYIVSMILAFTTRYGDVELKSRLQLPIGLCWIMIAAMQLAINGFHFTGRHGKSVFLFVKAYFLPHVILHMYTIVLMVCGKVEWRHLGTNVTVYIPSLLAVLSVYLFGTKAFKYNAIALIISWLLSVTSSICLVGPHIVGDAILQAYFDYSAKNYLELHDLVLAIGYLVVYYFYVNHQMTRKNFAVIFGTLLIMTLGMKRIVLLALVVVFAFNVFIKQVSEENRYRVVQISGIVGIILCFLFVYICTPGSLFYDLMNMLHINTKGRIYYYSTAMGLVEFSPSFLGLGRNVLTDILTSRFAYLDVAGIHSDIIKMYVENGFVMFALWLWYYLVKLPRIYYKYFGDKAAVTYFVMVVYTFMLYLTDNIEIYFICQIFSIIIPVTYALEEAEGKVYEK